MGFLSGDELVRRGRITDARAIELFSCFKNGESFQQVDKWRMRRDPGAWGSGNPKYLALGFSKGATQADIYTKGDFDEVAFGGDRMLAGHQQEIQAERDRKLEAARKQRQIRHQQAA